MNAYTQTPYEKESVELRMGTLEGKKNKSITMNKASGSDGTPVELFKILKDTSVSLLLSHTQGYCYHLSKFHIYALVYCIGVFPSGLLHSV